MRSYFSGDTWPNRCEQHLFMVIALGCLPSKTWMFSDRSPLVRFLELGLVLIPSLCAYLRYCFPTLPWKFSPGRSLLQAACAW